MHKVVNVRKIILNPEKKKAGTIPRAAKILSCLGNNINTVTDIANQCLIAKSTVHRVLKLLEESYMVIEDPVDRRYYLGPLITNLTINPVVTHEYLIRCAHEEMRRLASISEETVTLDILIGIQSVPLHEIPSIHEIRVTDDTKKFAPIFTGASSKVLLSQFSDERLRITMKYINIPRVTESTVTDKELLTAQIKEIRERGYCVTRGERIKGGLCVSVPILNYTSPVVMSIIGPEYRFKTRLEAVTKELVFSGSRISRNVLDIYNVTPHQMRDSKSPADAG
jgi:IclR family transcriptional regulator, KDG regulon repressor